MVPAALFAVHIEALRPEMGNANLNRTMRLRMDELALRNPQFSIDGQHYLDARALLSQGQYGALDTLLKRFE